MVTAEEFIFRNFKEKLTDSEKEIAINNGIGLSHEHYMSSMIEFAKLHVTAALKEASEKAEHHYSNKDWVDKESIITAYPLTNIK